MSKTKIGTDTDGGNVCEAMCIKQPDKTAEYFCNSHEVFCCSACKITEHEICKNVDHVPEVETTVGTSTELKELQKRLTELLYRNESMKSEIIRNSKAVILQAERAKKHIRVLRSKVEEKFDNLESKIVKSVDALKCCEEAKLTELRNKVESISQELQKHAINTERSLANSKMCQLFVTTKCVKKSVKDLSEEITKISQDSNIERYQFTPDPTIIKLLQNIKEIGVLDIKDKYARIPHFEKDISARVENSDVKDCMITSMAKLSETLLVAADFRNESVKLIDVVKSDVEFVYKLPGFGTLAVPFGLATSETRPIAVTYPYRRKIQLLKLSDSGGLMLDREIDAKSECFGIGYTGNNLVVSFRNPSSVKILTMKGLVIRKIAGSFTEFPDYVTVNERQNLVYISNWSSPGPGSVISVSPGGESKASFKDVMLYGPHGSCIDKYGVVYICGRFSQNVSQLSKDCSMIQEMLNKDDGLKGPLCVALTDENNKLYVGTEDGNIKVFTLY